MSDQPKLQKTNRRNTSIPVIIGMSVVVAFFVISGIVSYNNVKVLQEVSGKLSHTYTVVADLEDLLSLLRAAETGQRGMVITGDEKYLEPYNIALTRIESRLAEIEAMISDNRSQQVRLPVLRNQIGIKLKEMAEVVAARRGQGFDAARAVILTDRGKAAMDGLRAEIQAMEEEERTLLGRRSEETERAFGAVVRSGIISGLLGICMTVIAAWLIRRTSIARERQAWLQTGQNLLSEKLMGDQPVAALGNKALTFLCEYLDARAGVIFTEDGGVFRRAATYAVPATAGLPETFVPGEGLPGQAVRDRRTFVVNDVPGGYLTIGSALGSASPRHLLVTPAQVEGEVNAVLELGFFERVPEAAVELLTRTSEIIGVAVRSANTRARIQELLEETQRQSEEVQAQSEELRVSNEELEEQSRALQGSQSQLEKQQTELEQTNVQLEEQTQLLQAQKEGLIRAQLELKAQARVVEQASRYKSDFLANMSHELRTPLNSSLILAKLLADNREGNLTADQIKFAQTIQTAGNDLLALINDVLDLAKVESGHMELKPSVVTAAEFIASLRGLFDPVAGQKGLELKMKMAPGAPESFETDPQRLEQVLKNLLSNALKFTETGSVTLHVSAGLEGRIVFAVQDTGIGIPPEQQRIVFEPFCQADGTTNRKYGGTGLGLSISREITHLLGGEITLHSEPGKGSTFTVTLPLKLPAGAPAVKPPPAGSTGEKPRAAEPPAREPLRPAIPDDRDALTGSSRVVLIVEDDVSFASVMADLARELRFQCLIATTAEEALALAQRYVPGAIVLDVGLPDDSGLFVLERLKRDAKTRHIPVHVVSGGDYVQPALSMGAMGYALKPVKREELVSVFEKLETHLSETMRRVLIVEDDAVQLDSLQLLLGSSQVESVGVRTAAECLEKLRSNTYDCMVLDLSLPDASGFSLLETLSAGDKYSFPPVIVYTGRELSAEEEQRLRKYSASIIVKGARSPERLLDEVTLFLHQVVSELPDAKRRMLEAAQRRDSTLEGRHILLAEDDVRNIFALTSFLEPLGLKVQIARNGREALEALDRSAQGNAPAVDLVLMDIMMPEMDGLTAMQEIRKRPEWKKLPVIALTAKAMKNDQEQCLQAGASDYLAKPLDVEKLLSLIRVWMPR